MRIIAGKHRGTKLEAPEGVDVRPTSERAREALFSMIESGRFGDVLRDKPALDLFAGTGALGLEALSRGASTVTLVESGRAALEPLRRNATKLKSPNSVFVREADATRYREKAKTPAGLIFLDPPYGTGNWRPALLAVEGAGWVDAETLVIVEVAKKEPVEVPDPFEEVEQRVYGAARLVLLRKAR